MDIKKYCITLVLLLLLGTEAVHSQESRTEVCIDFRVNSTSIDPGYSDNASRIQEIISFLQDIRRDKTVSIIEVSFCGSASPEGSDRLNRRLARERLTTLENVLRKEVHIPDSIITRNDSYIPWDYLKSCIEDSDLERKEEILAILEEETRMVGYKQPNMYVDSRIMKLKQLDNGKLWQQMNRLFFERMRNACAVFVTYKEIVPPVQEKTIPSDTVEKEPAPQAEPTAPETTGEKQISVPEPREWTRQLHLKTNATGLVLAVANIAAEIDLARHWSFTLPIYYSAWDHFVEGYKFRTFAIQPEFRYWFSQDNDRFFVGAHFGFAHYNLAFNGDYRYQDHDRETPAIGGGLSIGYRLPLGRNGRWKLEFSVGAGAYPLHYDKFHHTPDTKDGLLMESVKETYWGIDQAAVSFAYTLDMKKKGGKR